MIENRTNVKQKDVKDMVQVRSTGREVVVRTEHMECVDRQMMGNKNATDE